MSAPVRFVQLKRMLSLPEAPTTAAAARDAIAAAPAAFAAALVAEALASDDVSDGASAIDYIVARLAWFADLVPDPAAVEALARAEVAAWER
jgi:hypothetical protein